MIAGPVAVTGAASGIGKAVVRALNLFGIATVSLDVREPTELPANGIFIELDVTDETAAETAVAVAETHVGPLHGLVNAAGILGKIHPPERIRLSDWEREIRIDLTGTYILARAVGARMAERGAGSIVNLASIAGMSSAPTHAYAAAKAGVISLTRSLAQAWGRQGVRVNAVSPGFTRTPALVKAIEMGVLDEAKMAGPSALGRLLEADEVADAVCWLLGSGSRGITGINLPVDAGFLAGSTWGAYESPS